MVVVSCDLRLPPFSALAPVPRARAGVIKIWITSRTKYVREGREEAGRDLLDGESAKETL